MSDQAQAWKPPAADAAAGWTPPAADAQAQPKPYDATGRGSKLKGTPEVPDDFGGTLLKDAANLPHGAYMLLRHPSDSAEGIVNTIYDLPHDTMQAMREGKWGKIAARALETFLPMREMEAPAGAAEAAGAVKSAAKSVTGAAVDTLSSPGVRDVVGIFSPRAGRALDLASKLRKATESMGVSEGELTPGQLEAKAAGQDWSSLKPDERALMEQIGKAKANIAAQPPPAPAAPISPTNPAPIFEQGPVKSIADLIREELEAQNGGAPTAAPSAPLPGARTPTVIPSRGTPVRPPLAQAPPAQAAAAAAPAQISLPQAEAWMSRKAPPPVEEPRSPFTATGETKSPQLRAAEIKGANVEAKAQRWAEVLHQNGVSPEEFMSLNPGRVSMEQMQNGATRGLGNLTDDLIAKGVFKKGELPPSESIPKIVQKLKKLQTADIAQRLADEMKASGTIQ